MSTVIVVLGLVILLVLVFALLRRRKSRSSGGNAVNTDPDLESRYSLLGDNSGRMKK